VREGLLLPGKLIGRQPAHTSPPPPPVLSQPAAPPSFSVPKLVTAMSTFPTKNLIFLHDSKSNLKFLVDSGASISILLHSSSAPSTGPHLVGANGKLAPTWGRRPQIVYFAGHDFEFDFFLAAVATPIIGMDFLAKFELSIIPAKQQVLHAASGRTLTKASTSSLVSPWSPETAAAVSLKVFSETLFNHRCKRGSEEACGDVWQIIVWYS
jgi:hypothetical protein